MKPRLLAIGCTLLGFTAGGCACYLALRMGRLPPPPATLFSEYRDILRLHPLPDSPLDRTAIFRQAIQLWPRIEQYRGEMAAIDEGFRQRIATSLRPEQRVAFELLLTERRQQMQDFRELIENPRATTMADGAAAPETALRERLLLEPLVGVASIVQVGTVTDLLTVKLNLSEDQKAEVRALLIERRTRFLEFMDQQPPPSMSLGILFEPKR